MTVAYKTSVVGNDYDVYVSVIASHKVIRLWLLAYAILNLTVSIKYENRCDTTISQIFIAISESVEWNILEEQASSRRYW